jgi:hypothetical protein
MKKIECSAFLTLKTNKVKKGQIWTFFCVFEVRGAGQDRKGRRYLPAPGHGSRVSFMGVVLGN